MCTFVRTNVLKIQISDLFHLRSSRKKVSSCEKTNISFSISKSRFSVAHCRHSSRVSSEIPCNPNESAFQIHTKCWKLTHNHSLYTGWKIYLNFQLKIFGPIRVKIPKMSVEHMILIPQFRFLTRKFVKFTRNFLVNSVRCKELKYDSFRTIWAIFRVNVTIKK